MKLAFQETVAAALPSEERLRDRLAVLPEKEWTDLALVFAAGLPEVDTVLALPGAEGLAQALAQARGLPVLGALAPLQEAQPGAGAVLVTRDLTDGLRELRALLNAEHHGVRVVAVVAAIERTDDQGHTRLALQGLPVLAAAQLAGTPRGLVFERRIPHQPPPTWPQAS